MGLCPQLPAILLTSFLVKEPSSPGCTTGPASLPDSKQHPSIWWSQAKCPHPHTFSSTISAAFETQKHIGTKNIKWLGQQPDLGKKSPRKTSHALPQARPSPQGGLHHWHRKGGRKGPAPPLGKYSGHSLFKPKNTVFPLPLIIPTLKITMFLNEKEKSFSNWKCRRQALLTCGLLQSPWGAEFGKSLSHWRKGAQLNKNLHKSPWQLRKGNKGFSSSLLLPPPFF